MVYLLFLLGNLVLLSRPAELDPELVPLRLYAITITFCALLAIPFLLEQFRVRALEERPITLCVLGLLVTVVLSHLTNAAPTRALVQGQDFLKTTIYYLLVVGLVTTVNRLRGLLYWTVGCYAFLALLSLIQYYGYADFTPLDAIYVQEYDAATGGEVTTHRMRGPGTLFGDPNDLCALFVTAILICLYALLDTRLGFLRWTTLPLLVLFACCAYLTHSRGGFLGLVAGIVYLSWALLGFKRALPLFLGCVPALFVVMAGRMTNLEIGGGTGQQRIWLWSDAMSAFRAQPLFGIGMNEHAKQMGLVAHNSFLECYAELGIFGGTFFLAAFFVAFRGCRKPAVQLPAVAIDRAPPPLQDALELARLRPYLQAILVAYAVALMSISRNYVLTTYTILGCGTVYARLAHAHLGQPFIRADARLLRWVVVLSLGFLTAMYLFVRVARN